MDDLYLIGLGIDVTRHLSAEAATALRRTLCRCCAFPRLIVTSVCLGHAGLVEGKRYKWLIYKSL
jgi:hypothetical protein